MGNMGPDSNVQYFCCSLERVAKHDLNCLSSLSRLLLFMCETGGLHCSCKNVPILLCKYKCNACSLNNVSRRTSSIQQISLQYCVNLCLPIYLYRQITNYKYKFILYYSYFTLYFLSYLRKFVEFGYDLYKDINRSIFSEITNTLKLTISYWLKKAQKLNNNQNVIIVYFFKAPRGTSVNSLDGTWYTYA